MPQSSLLQHTSTNQPICEYTDFRVRLAERLIGTYNTYLLAHRLSFPESTAEYVLLAM
jgi:hypothetical protein